MRCGFSYGRFEWVLICAIFLIPHFNECVCFLLFTRSLKKSCRRFSLACMEVVVGGGGSGGGSGLGSEGVVSLCYLVYVGVYLLTIPAS